MPAYRLRLIPTAMLPPDFKRQPPLVLIRWYYPSVKERLLKIIISKNREAPVMLSTIGGFLASKIGRANWKHSELAFEKKDLIPAVQQLLLSCEDC